MRQLFKPHNKTIRRNREFQDVPTEIVCFSSFLKDSHRVRPGATPAWRYTRAALHAALHPRVATHALPGHSQNLWRGTTPALHHTRSQMMKHSGASMSTITNRIEANCTRHAQTMVPIFWRRGCRATAILEAGSFDYSRGVNNTVDACFRAY